MTDPTPFIDEAAETFDVELSDAERDAYAEEFAATQTLLTSLAPTDFDSEQASDVREGDDQHNAFRYRCSLSGEGGSLDGLAVAVKDNIAVAGVPMTCGSAAVEFEPSYHASVTERLLDAGADLVGTTNMDEFAYFTTSETCAHGPVGNPAVEGGVPGGSSSGSGAAVAAGSVDAALGTDTGGSIRIPASYCGVVGLKPTFRTVPRFGFADLASSLDHIGPLAPDVATAATVLDAINGPDVRDPSTQGTATPTASDGLDADPDGLSVGLVTEAQTNADDAVAAAIESAADDLREAGVTVEEVSLSGFHTQPLVNSAVTATEFTTLAANAGQDHGVGTGYSEPWRETLADLDTDALGENVRSRLVLGRALTRADEGRGYVAAQNVRQQFTQLVETRLDEYDALLLSTTPNTAPDYGEVTGDEALLRTIAHTSPFNCTGHPALSVPVAGIDAPVGCQFVTSWYDEATAVTLGAALE